MAAKSIGSLANARQMKAWRSAVIGVRLKIISAAAYNSGVANSGWRRVGGAYDEEASENRRKKA